MAYTNTLPPALQPLAERLRTHTIPAVADCERPAAVLVPVVPGADDVDVLLIRRPDDLHEHAGQMACPGGSWDATDPTLWATALREAEEEVGIPPGAVACVGPLPAVYIPRTRFTLVPFVGWLARRPVLRPEPREVAAAFWVPLGALRRTRRTVVRVRGGVTGPFPEFELAEGRVWGATAIFLDALLALWPPAEVDRLIGEIGRTDGGAFRGDPAQD
jgi:8-oxo-dGTP pyrophosphatase MutT (NUDIX family)